MLNEYLAQKDKFLSTPSARRATLRGGQVETMDDISIHALREEGDCRASFCSTVDTHFYPRPPRGGRQNVNGRYDKKNTFLSTPSARRATGRGQREPHPHYISIHALREEGDCAWKRPSRATANFYPRPPRGGRLKELDKSLIHRAFLSTPSARRATDDISEMNDVLCISIHALREEGDSKNGEKHLRFCFIIKRSAQIWKSLSKNIRKNSCDLHRTA